MSEKIGIRPATIVIQENKILLVHSKYNDKEFFLFPGGGMEFGETIEQTAIRETLEETGVKVKIKDIFHINEYINNKDWNERSISIFFLAEVEEIGEPLTNDSGKIKDIVWIDIKDLNKYDVKPSRMIELLQNLEKPHKIYSIDFKNN
jgi:mutator protein MutT